MFRAVSKRSLKHLQNGPEKGGGAHRPKPDDWINLTIRPNHMTENDHKTKFMYNWNVLYISVLGTLYSGDLNSELVWYSNGPK